MPGTLPPYAIFQAKVQAVFAIGIGISLIVAPLLASHNPIFDRLFGPFLPNTPPTPPDYTLELIQICAVTGVLLIAIGQVYLVSLYHGYEEWIYASVPVRLTMGAIAALIWVVAPEKMSPWMMACLVWDGGLAIPLGLSVGSWTGQKPPFKEA